MTTFILAGGCDRQYPEYRKRIFDIIRQETMNPVILSCMFAWPKETRLERQEEYAQWFREELGQDAKVLYAQESRLFEQIEESDVIYLHGGHTKLLLDAIQDREKFSEAVRGKIVVGSSAGANFISKACFSPTSQAVFKDSGLLNVGVIVHYGVEHFEEHQCTMDSWRIATRMVQSQLDADIPLLLLPEGQFAVFVT